LVHSCDRGLYQYKIHSIFDIIMGLKNIHSITFGFIPLFNILMCLSIFEITFGYSSSCIRSNSKIVKLCVGLCRQSMCSLCSNIYTITSIPCMAIQTSGQTQILLHPTGVHWPKEWHQTLILGSSEHSHPQTTLGGWLWCGLQDLHVRHRG